jgi:DNA-binding CsgD family transcriptional regulator
MTAPLTPSERDLHRLAGIVTERRDDIPAEGVPLSLLSDLVEYIRCECVSLERFDSRDGSGRVLSEFPAPEEPWERDAGPVHWQHYWTCQPCSYPDRTGDLAAVIKIPDFYSARQWHSTGMYADVFRPKGIEHELMLTLPPAPGQDGPRQGTPGPRSTLRMFFFRGPGSDFSEADRDALTLLRPHLYEACLEAERRRHPAPELTPRQRELLGLVAEGYTNGQIARRLSISEGTVRTHLENIYRRLEVTSRTAAIARVFS